VERKRCETLDEKSVDRSGDRMEGGDTRQCYSVELAAVLERW
jgi:hypothetical protein